MKIARHIFQRVLLAILILLHFSCFVIRLSLNTLQIILQIDLKTAIIMLIIISLLMNLFLHVFLK